MRIKKSITGYSEVNTRGEQFFEIKVIAPVGEREKIEKCYRKVEKLVEGIDREPDKGKEDSVD